MVEKKKKREKERERNFVEWNVKEAEKRRTR